MKFPFKLIRPVAISLIALVLVAGAALAASGHAPQLTTATATAQPSHMPEAVETPEASETPEANETAEATKTEQPEDHNQGHDKQAGEDKSGSSAQTPATQDGGGDGQAG